MHAFRQWLSSPFSGGLPIISRCSSGRGQNIEIVYGVGESFKGSLNICTASMCHGGSSFKARHVVMARVRFEDISSCCFIRRPYGQDETQWPRPLSISDRSKIYHQC